MKDFYLKHKDYKKSNNLENLKFILGSPRKNKSHYQDMLNAYFENIKPEPERPTLIQKTFLATKEPKKIKNELEDIK